MKIINDFLIGLQFLTRIQLVNQTHWTEESFGRSVKYFPLVGLVIGLILVALQLLFTFQLPQWGISLPSHTTTTLLLLSMITLSGGLTCDGFMDTMDGIFSGRSRERMMEIMKDSRVGANGVMAFVLLLLFKYSLLLDLPPDTLIKALVITPVYGKFAMVIAITTFPYARSEGIGKAFAQFTNKHTLLTAAIFTITVGILSGLKTLLVLLAVIIFTVVLSKYITKILGGLTGDVYGAVNELADVVSLVMMLILV